MVGQSHPCKVRDSTSSDPFLIFKLPAKDYCHARLVHTYSRTPPNQRSKAMPPTELCPLAYQKLGEGRCGPKLPFVKTHNPPALLRRAPCRASSLFLLILSSTRCRH